MASIQLERGSISNVMTTEIDSLANTAKKLSGEIDNTAGGALDLFDDVLLHTADCRQCHAELSPYRPDDHHINRQVLTATCASCHVAQE